MSYYTGIFKKIIKKHKNAQKWDTGNFSGIKSISNTKVGTVGQEFIEWLCGDLNIPCEFPVNKDGERASQSPWDLKIGGVTFELKTATEDTSNKFQFNHIRYHREYNAVLCLGVSPDELYFNLWSKADIVTNKAGNLVSMDKGANASYKLTKTKHELLHIDTFATKIKKFIAPFKKIAKTKKKAPTKKKAAPRKK